MTTQTAVKKLEFENIVKNYKKFTAKKKGARPNLQYVHFDKNYLVATNGYILLRIKSEYVDNIPEKFTPGMLYDIKNQKVIEGNYPNTDQLIPDKDSLLTTINNKQANEIISSLKQLKELYKNDKNKIVNIQENLIIAKYAKMNDKIFFSPEGNFKKSITLESISFPQVDIYLNGDYMKYVLETIKKINKITRENTEIHYYGNLRPILFTQPGIFDILILPIRIY